MVAMSATIVSQRGLSMIVPYLYSRRQFAPNKDSEPIPIIEYRIHKFNILPRIATAYLLKIAMDKVKEPFWNNSEEYVRFNVYSDPTLQLKASAFKIFSTQFNNDTLMLCRQSCGGQGYLSHNGLIDLIQDSNIYSTYET